MPTNNTEKMGFSVSMGQEKKRAVQFENYYLRESL